MHPIKVLYDGWPLIRQPSSPAAIHLLTILRSLPNGVEPVLALPDVAPEWLNTHTRIETKATAIDENARRKWEQSSLGKLAKNVDATLIHTTNFNAPLFAQTPVLVSPCGYQGQELEGQSLSARLRRAQGRGGLSRAAGVLWPEDIPLPKDLPNTISLPATIHPDFVSIPIGEQEAPTIPGVEMPETYTLFHGPGNEATLHTLLQAWTWAQGPIGEYYPLLLVGLNSNSSLIAKNLINEFGFGSSVKIMPRLEPTQLIALYQNCSAVFHPAKISAWGGAIRLGLACGRTVVAFEQPDVDALAGPAAFLVPPNDLRSFGAAMISTVIKESIYEPLSEAAIKRSHAWRSNEFENSLLEIYRQVI
ncbi:MAG: glycosyltransferase [Chloroflexota bacterium]